MEISSFTRDSAWVQHEFVHWTIWSFWIQEGWSEIVVIRVWEWWICQDLYRALLLSPTSFAALSLKSLKLSRFCRRWVGWLGSIRWDVGSMTGSHCCSHWVLMSCHSHFQQHNPHSQQQQLVALGKFQCRLDLNSRLLSHPLAAEFLAMIRPFLSFLSLHCDWSGSSLFRPSCPRASEASAIIWWIGRDLNLHCCASPLILCSCHIVDDVVNVNRYEHPKFLVPLHRDRRALVEWVEARWWCRDVVACTSRRTRKSFGCTRWRQVQWASCTAH